MRVVLYARVSTESQTSVAEQRAAMLALVEREGWKVIGVFVDDTNYIATQAPRRGQLVNPSGERADRPEFQRMLDVIRPGEAEAVLCWRDDRLIRHPRVIVALEDALEVGDHAGKRKIQVIEANGARLDRFTLNIKASLWREENKRRVERARLGKKAALREGRWPNRYTRLGYRAVRDPDKRGLRIVIEEEEAQTVRNIFGWCIAGCTLNDIRDRLIAADAEQKGTQKRRRHDWHTALISQILSAEEYAGRLTWKFGDGDAFTIDIPQIITPERWRQAQEAIARHKKVSPRNAKGVYMLQGLLECGECGAGLGVRTSYYYYGTLMDGTRKRYAYRIPIHKYKCADASSFKETPHPRPHNFSGKELDDKVWRKLVDFGIKRPDLVRQQIEDRQAELKAQGDGADTEIERIQQKLAQIGNERASYQRQLARGKITEAEFDARMDETVQRRLEYESELDSLKTLRDKADTVRAGLEYSERLLTAMRDKLQAIDMTADDLRQLSRADYFEVVRERRKIVEALVERVKVYANGKVEILGVLDGSTADVFELERPGLHLPKFYFSLVDQFFAQVVQVDQTC